MSYDLVTDHVTKVLTCMSLVHLRHRVVGLEGGPGGLSAGERRRLLVAQHLSPGLSVLLLDDPCRGLDGYQSQRIMELLKDVAGDGRTVICTLNQPRSLLVAMLLDYR